jgi:hypothetical protein
MEHGKRDRVKEARAVAETRRETISRNRPPKAIYCFMFHFDLIVPDLPDGKGPEIIINQAQPQPASSG